MRQKTLDIPPSRNIMDFKQVKIKNSEPTNFIQRQIWYLSSLEIARQIQIKIDICESIIADIKLKGKGSQKRSSWEELLEQIKSAQILIKACPNDIDKLFISMNLGAIYDEMQMNHYASASFNYSILLLSELLFQYPIPVQAVHQLKAFERRYWIHVRKAQLSLALCMSSSKEGHHKEAFQSASNAKNLFIEACHQLLIIYLYRFHHFIDRFKNKRDLRKEPIIAIDFANFQMCVSTLFSICESERNVYNGKNGLLEKLRITIENLLQKISNKRYFPEHEQIQHEAGYLLKKKSFLDIIRLDLVEKVDIIGEIQVEMSEIHQTVAYLIASYYCLSAQTKYLQSAENIYFNEVKASEHWLSKSFQLCSKILPNSIFYRQIKELNRTLHAVNNQVIKEEDEDVYVQNPSNSRKKKIIDKKNVEYQVIKTNELDPIVLKKYREGRTQEQSRERKGENLPKKKGDGIAGMRKAYETVHNSPKHHFKVRSSKKKDAANFSGFKAKSEFKQMIFAE